jgi:hypothetical protein
MGYIIIDEEKLHAQIALWNNANYKSMVLSDISRAKADYSHMVEVLQRAANEIDQRIEHLESQKCSLSSLMRLANTLK